MKKKSREKAGRQLRSADDEGIRELQSVSRNAQSADPVLVRLVLGALLLFVLVRIAFVLIDTSDGRLWGVNFVWYLDSSVVAGAILCLPLLGFLRGVDRWLAGLLNRMEAVPRSDLRSALVTCGAIAIVGAASWNISVAYPFLGDGAVYLTEIYRIFQGGAGYASSLIKPSSWLTGHVLRWLALSHFGSDLQAPYVLVSAISLAVVVAALRFFLRGERAVVALFVTSSVLLSSASLLYFGYVELYALQYACTVAFFLAGFASLRHDRSVLWATAAWVLASAFGASSIIYLPALAWLLGWAVWKERFCASAGKWAIYIALAIPLAAIAGYIIYSPLTFEGYLSPLARVELYHHELHGDWSNYTLFSLQRWSDIANVLLLNGGPMLLLLPFLIPALRRDGTWKNDPLLLFSLLAAEAGFVLLIVANASLGYSRDWDLATVPVFGLVFLSVVVLLILHERGVLRLQRVLPALLLLLASTTASWMLVNTSAASAARFEALLRMDTGVVSNFVTYNGWENLRKYAYERNETDLHQRSLFALLETGYNRPDTYEKLLTTVSTLKTREQQRAGFSRLFAVLERDAMLALRTDDFRALPRDFVATMSARILISASSMLPPGEIAIAASRFSQLLPGWRLLPLVRTFYDTTLTSDAITSDVELSVDSSVTDAGLLFAAASGMQRAGAAQRAISYYERLLQSDSISYPAAYIRLARAYYETRSDLSATRNTLERCVRNSRGTEEAGQARDLLQQLAKATSRSSSLSTP